MWGDMPSSTSITSPRRARSTWAKPTDAKGKSDDRLPDRQRVARHASACRSRSSRARSAAVVIPQGATGDVTIDNERITSSELVSAGPLQPCSRAGRARSSIRCRPVRPRACSTAAYLHRRAVSPASPSASVGARQLNLKDYIWTLFVVRLPLACSCCDLLHAPAARRCRSTC